MTEIFYSLISKALGIPARQVEKTMGLLDEGATIPFISRYRKEVTGGLDEVQIGDINDHYGKLKEVSKRKETILASIDEQGKLTPNLKNALRPRGIARSWKIFTCLTSRNGRPKRRLPAKRGWSLWLPYLCFKQLRIVPKRHRLT